MSNTFGKLFRLTTFGESHGKAVGGIIDGCPANIILDLDFIQNELNRRKPGQSKITTQRKEDDKVEFLSGIFEGKTTGAPIGFVIWNNNQKSKDYDNLRYLFRPSHADFTYQQKYGIRDHRGGGRSSARVTASRVVAGAIAKQILSMIDIKIIAYTSQIGDLQTNKPYYKLDLNTIEDNIVRCPDEDVANKMIKKIEEIKKNGDSIGGLITCVIKNVPIGLGEPEFEKFHAILANAILSINAAKGFEIGSGFESAKMYGSQHNDEFYIDSENKIKTKTNNSGGVQGGITNGEDIFFKVAFKPVATILKKQNTVDYFNKPKNYLAAGRHDPCILPRAVPIVEAMSAIVLLDYYLQNKSLNSNL